MNQLAALAPESDYDTIRAAIRYLSENGPDATDLPRFARALGLTERQLTELFRRWCGLSPKSFAQAVALDHAKSLLRNQASVLDTTYEVGLSSTSRLHDLFVTYEAMPPGVFRAGGEGIDMIWGVAPSPFGLAVITALITEFRGLALPMRTPASKKPLPILPIAGRGPGLRAMTRGLPQWSPAFSSLGAGRRIIRCGSC
ncbi:AraC family transcriptional regulator [Devosia soli]|uniref:AraC family transcriptional regulator n=1 Tax=Devosia soli TaxID=361041 RepID=UPI000A649365